MDNLATASSHPEDIPLMRRRNSITASDLVVPTRLAFLGHRSSSSTITITTSSSSSSSASSFPYDDLELLPIKPNPHSYTSLKDLLPSSAAVNSPMPSAAHLAHPGSDICIRNRLVKQAAWAYLQPTYTSPGPASGGFLHRLWPRVAAAFDFLCRSIRAALDRTLRALRIRSSR